MPILSEKFAPPPKTSINKYKHIRKHSENNTNLRYTFYFLQTRIVYI